MRFRIDNRPALESAFKQIAATLKVTGYIEITTNGKRRSGRQNDCYWPWCREIAAARDDGTSEYDVDAEVKLAKAFALRREDDHEFDELLTRTIDKLWPSGGRYDLAHDLAKEMQCTSKLSAEKMSKLLEWMQMHYWSAMRLRLETR